MKSRLLFRSAKLSNVSAAGEGAITALGLSACGMKLGVTDAMCDAIWTRPIE